MSDENKYYSDNYGEQSDSEQAEPEKVYAEPVADNKTDSDHGYEKYNDFSRYNDSTQKTEQEPPYSPYNAQQYQSSTPYADAQSKTESEKRKKKSKGLKGFLIALVAVVVCVSVALAGAYFLMNKDNVEEVETGDSTQLSISDTPTVKNTSNVPTSEEIAAKAEKFNVGIKLYGQAQSIFSSSSSNSLVGEGSGIIMSEDSSKQYTYIVTCAHVISDVKTSGYTMTVTDYEGNTYDGVMVGYDEKTDVGVIKIKKTGLNAAEFGNSSALKKGQTVYVIGNPGGSEFFGSFTKGMISAIDRPISSESGYEMKCIQHTTPINSGNSGGALMNEFGQVVGINSSKIVSTGYEGMAFAVPISDAKEIIDDIIANGYVTDRPKLGISYAAAEKYQQYAMVVKLKDLPSGSLVIASISDDSSLANTNVKVGDMITAVNGQKLDSADILLDKIENGKVGDKLKLEICRINSDYSIDTFTVDAELVEDKGGTSTEQTTQQSQNPYDWSQFFGGY